MGLFGILTEKERNLVNKAITQERERIIKLLDDWKCGHPDCDGDKTEVCYPKHYLIQLIKEQTNG